MFVQRDNDCTCTADKSRSDQREGDGLLTNCYYINNKRLIYTSMLKRAHKVECLPCMKLSLHKVCEVWNQTFTDPRGEERPQYYWSGVRPLTLQDYKTYLDSRGVEKSSHHVLAAAVGRQVERGQTSLAGQLSHQALGLGCRDLMEL